MEPFLMIQGLFVTGVLMFAGGFYASQAFNYYSGSPTAKLAVDTSAKCEAKKDDASLYTSCIKDLQSQIAIMSDTKELKLDDCDEAGTKAYCWVRVWLVPHRLTLTKAALAELRKQHSLSASDKLQYNIKH